jgi:hypothetical protein
VTFSNTSSDIFGISEIIYTPSQDYIQLCLVNIGKGTPLISAIELRPLNNTAYVTNSAKSALSNIVRSGLGSQTEFGYRSEEYIP